MHTGTFYEEEYFHLKNERFMGASKPYSPHVLADWLKILADWFMGASNPYSSLVLADFVKVALVKLVCVSSNPL